MSAPHIRIHEYEAMIVRDEFDAVLYADLDERGWYGRSHKDGIAFGDSYPIPFELVLAVLPREHWDWALARHDELLDAAERRFDQCRGMLASSSPRGAQAMGYGYAEQAARTLDRLTGELDRVVRHLDIASPLAPQERRELDSGARNPALPALA